MTGLTLPTMEISRARLTWARIRTYGIKKTTYEEFTEEWIVKKRNNSRI